MIQAIRIHSPGGPEALVLEQIECPVPGPGEVLIRHAFIGVNFVDVYHRKGLYPLPSYPGIPGVEGAGTVEALGEGVTGIGIGERVAYAGLPPGGYAEARVIAAEQLIKLPDSLPLRDAAAMMLRGITARMLLTEVHPVGAGDIVLMHAAAGGLGLMVTQWAKRLGASVGQAAGASAVVDDAWLSSHPRVRLVRPSVLGYLADAVKYRAAAEDLFAMVAAGLKVSVGAEYPLIEAIRAHADLEARRTTGSVFLVP